jgi:hypothetical protein
MGTEFGEIIFGGLVANSCKSAVQLAAMISVRFRLSLFALKLTGGMAGPAARQRRVG